VTLGAPADAAIVDNLGFGTARPLAVGGPEATGVVVGTLGVSSGLVPSPAKYRLFTLAVFG
jgi:hypothetical protein